MLLIFYQLLQDVRLTNENSDNVMLGKKLAIQAFHILLVVLFGQSDFGANFEFRHPLAGLCCCLKIEMK